MNSNFKIKRGMVFFIDATKIPICTSESTPTKLRPYVVLSNDLCNEGSNMIHAAPIFTRTTNDEKKWYRIPFKGTQGRDCCVDIGNIMLIPRQYFTSEAYSQSITNIVRYNKNLFDLIGQAICRQFDVDRDVTRQEVINTIQQYPVNNTPFPIIPNIALNISVNGVPVNPTSITQAVEDSKDVSIIVETTIDKEKVDAKKKENTFEFEKIDLKTGNRMSDEQKDRLINFIKANYTQFGGSMTAVEISRVTGVNRNTIFKYVKNLNKSESMNKNNTKNRVKRTKLKRSMYKDFLEFYMNHTVQETLDEYKKYGFNSCKAMYNLAYRIKKEMSTSGVKCKTTLVKK